MAFSLEVALDSVRRALASKRLAHAYLIAGGDDSTRRTLAAQLTSLATGVPASDGEIPTDPDVRVLNPESKSRKIDIEAVRELSDALSMRPSRAAGRKVGILLDAERLVPAAANAFLKTLEEPPGNSLLLLVSGRPESLLETILSRCIRIELIAPEAAPTARERLVAELLEAAAARAQSAASRVAGAYGALREFQAVLGAAKDEIRGEEDAQFEAVGDKYDRKDYEDWLDEQEEYFKTRSEARYLAERERLVGAIARWWQTVLHASLGIAKNPTAAQSALAARLPVSEILRRVERLEELHEWLGRNINEAIALEVAFLDVFA